jgi:galactokinase
MGGIAEYCGALTLSAKAADSIQVEVTLRQDERVAIRVANHSASFKDRKQIAGNQIAGNQLAGKQIAGNQIAGNGDRASVRSSSATDVMADWPLGIFYGVREGEFSATETVVGYSRSAGGGTVGLALAVLRSMLVAKVVPHFGGGLSIQIDSKLLGDRTRQSASIASCLFQAVSKAYSVEFPASNTAAILHGMFEEFGAFKEFGGVHCGLATVASPMVDKPGLLSPICCCPLEIGEWVAIPAGLTLIGIDSGIVHPNATKKYLHARTTSMMGTAIIARLLGATNPNQDDCRVSLARITVSEYVERFRDLLPTKIRGQQFLERFGPLPDRTATIDANETYKIRSRTEHHIYENERVHHFVERLSRANRTGDAAAIKEAGELMYASHWSYGQRCGLGSRETDTLVNLLRGCGPGAGVYGARISGAGVGGTVVVLMRDSDETRSVIAGAVKQYEQGTGLKTVIQRAAPLHP